MSGGESLGSSIVFFFFVPGAPGDIEQVGGDKAAHLQDSFNLILARLTHKLLPCRSFCSHAEGWLGPNARAYR